MLKYVSAAAASILLFALAGCGQPSTETQTPGADAQSAPSSDLEAPALPGEVGAASTQPAPLPTVEPGVYRNGDFALRVEQAQLTHTTTNADVSLHLSMTITVFNTGQEPISVVHLSPGDNLTVALSNGMTITPSHTGDILGFGVCGGAAADPARCRTTRADHYTQIDPGASVSVNIRLRRAYSRTNPNLASIPSIDSGNIGMRLHVIQGASDRIVQASLLNTPIRNDIQL